MKEIFEDPQEPVRNLVGMYHDWFKGLEYEPPVSARDNIRELFNT